MIMDSIRLSCFGNKTNVSKKYIVEATSVLQQPKKIPEIVINPIDACEALEDPWIEKLIEKCIREETLGEEIAESQLGILIDNGIRSQNIQEYYISDGRLKMPLKTSTGNFSCRYKLTGNIVMMSSYKLRLIDGRFAIESSDFAGLENDLEIFNIINKRIKWLKPPECIPAIAKLMKDKCGIEPRIPDEEIEDWKECLIGKNEIASEDADFSTNIEEENERPVLEQDEDMSLLMSESPPRNTSAECFSTPEKVETNSEPFVTSTPQTNNQHIAELQPVNEDISAIILTEPTEKETSFACDTEVLPDKPSSSSPLNFSSPDAGKAKELNKSVKRSNCSGSAVDVNNQKHRRIDSNVEVQHETSNKVSDSSTEAGVEVETWKIKELHGIKHLYDENGKKYRLTVESVDEELENDDVEVMRNGLEPQKTQNDDEIIENSQPDAVPKHQTSVNRSSCDQANSTQGNPNLFPVILQLQPTEGQGKTVQVTMGKSKPKGKWRLVSNLTLSSDVNAAKLTKAIQELNSNRERDNSLLDFMKLFVGILKTNNP